MTTLIATIFKRRLLEWTRYPFELVFGLLAFYLVFVMVFIGAQVFGGEDVRQGDTLSAVAVGYIVFLLSQQAYQTIGQQLLTESTAGTLEQLAMSPVGLRRVLLVDFLAQCLLFAFTFGIVVFPIMLTTGRWLHLDPFSVVPLVVLLMTGIVGLGLGLGGLSVVFKRTQGAAQMVGFAFLFLVAAPVFEYPLLKLLPVAHGNALLRRVLVDGRSIVELGLGEWAIMIAVNASWLAAGLVVFGLMERKARERALLGQY